MIMDYNNNSYQNQEKKEQDNFYSYNGNSYGNTTYQNSYQNTNTPEEKPKREKKQHGFGMKLMKCTALALVFGLVAGTTFAGANYVVQNVLGVTQTEDSKSGSTKIENESVKNESDDTNKVKSTATTSVSYVSDVSDVVAEAMPSIVAITNVSETQYQTFFGMPQTYESTSCGSGIIVSQDDTYLYIATNNHVVDGATSLTVQFCNDTTVSAEIKGQDSSTDLAVVKVEIANIEEETLGEIKVATLGDSEELSVGKACIAIGNALGYGQSVTTGVISALGREVSVKDETSGTSYTSELIQTDAAINPGNSGGALLDVNGNVIGINSVKYSSTEVEGIGYAIPINIASPIINQLITQEKVDEADGAYLGIKGVDVSDDVAQTYNMPTGVYVAQVVENSAAAQAGICQGDIITAFNGKEITSKQALSETMEYYAAGTQVTITVQRAVEGQYTEQNIEVVLGSKTN